MAIIKYTGTSAKEEFPLTGVYCQWQPGQKIVITDQTRINTLLASDGWDIVYAELLDDNGTKRVSDGNSYSAVGVVDKPETPMQVVAFGTSISSYGFFNTTTANKNYYNTGSELANVLMHCGPALTTKIIGGATANSDNCGSYGYSGQTSVTLLSDSESIWIPQLSTASFIPDMIIYTGCQANDAVLSVSLATSNRTMLAILAAHKARWPGVVQVVCTPHPDSRLNTEALKAQFLASRDFILSLDNNKDILAVDLSGNGGYANPADITQPLPYYAYSSLQGALNNLQDIYGVHPNVRGAQVNGRLIANRIKNKFSTSAKTNTKAFKSVNVPLSGSITLTGTGNSGTAPTGASQASVNASGAACASTVSGTYPWEITQTPNDAVSGLVQPGLSTWRMSGNISNVTGNYAIFCKVKVLSGAESIVRLTGVITTNEATNGNLADWSISDAESYSFYPGWDGGPQGIKNGDELYLMTPMRSRSVAPTTVYHDVLLKIGKPGLNVSIAILHTGIVVG